MLLLLLLLGALAAVLPVGSRHITRRVQIEDPRNYADGRFLGSCLRGGEHAPFTGAQPLSTAFEFDNGDGEEGDEILYKEVSLKEMRFHLGKEETDDAPFGRGFYYDCPCGDKFFISEEDLQSGDQIARCPSCTLVVRIQDPGSMEEILNASKR
mmetsp:Transcript_10141/g.24969  ORF Transcript_10141/g.24969 Transcript_10141/m.24969 type:complete len:154 (+) Transcript_10141:134-595(+)